MKTEKELLEKLNQMILQKNKLREIIDNPPEGMLFSEIQENINGYNEQCHYIDFLEWVLDIEEEK